MQRSREWRKRGTFIPEETKNMRKVTCKVCEKSFYPKAQYVARARVITGGINSALSGNSQEPELFDAMDCPGCGCQLLLSKRLEEKS